MAQESRLSLIGQNRVFDINGGQVAGFRNKIIGGDFSVNPWQRGTSFAAVATGAYTADRWSYGNTSAAVHTISKDTSVPTVAQAGRFLTHCILVDCTTADAAVGAGDLVVLQQPIEGYNFLPIAQKPMVLSFWHAHTKTGTYCVAFGNSGADRSFVVEYTQSVSDAWEYSRITVFSSPSAGTWNYTSGTGLTVAFAIMAGSTFQTTANAWQNGNFFATSNQVNAADNTANNCRFALVQLESNISPTPFEDRTFRTELSLCQRYYEKSYAIDTSIATVTNLNASVGFSLNTSNLISMEQEFEIEKRTVPTVVIYGPVSGTINRVRNISTGVEAVTTGSTGTGTKRIFDITAAATLTASAFHDYHWTATAEL